MQRRPAAKSRQLDPEDVEGGGGSPAYAMQRQTSNASGISNGDGGIIIANSDNNGGGVAVLFADDSQGKARKPIKHSFDIGSLAFRDVSGDSFRVYALTLLAVTAVLFFLCSTTWSILLLVASACCFGTIVSLWLARAVLSSDDGTPEMRAVSDPIREGAEGFLRVQYMAVTKFAIPLAGLIIFSYQFRPNMESHDGVATVSNTMLGIVAATGFIFGAVCR